MATAFEYCQSILDYGSSEENERETYNRCHVVFVAKLQGHRKREEIWINKKKFKAKISNSSCVSIGQSQSNIIKNIRMTHTYTGCDFFFSSCWKHGTISMSYIRRIIEVTQQNYLSNRWIGNPFYVKTLSYKQKHSIKDFV